MEIIRTVLMVVFMAVTIISRGEGQLVENFNTLTCPNVESIMTQAVTTKFAQTRTIGQATLRLFLHDCFVEGCDASVMIASPNVDAEKDASENNSVAGDGFEFDTVNKVKQAVEDVCPAVVSGADILALLNVEAAGRGISNGAMRGNTIPGCSPLNKTNCRLPGANPYRRGCGAVNRCRGNGNDDAPYDDEDIAKDS